VKTRSVVPVLVVLLVVALTPAKANAPTRYPVWVDRSPARLFSVAATPLGGSVVAGTIGGWPDTKLYVTRYAAGGRELWHRRWQPIGSPYPAVLSDEQSLSFSLSAALGPDKRAVVAGSVGGRCPGWFVRVYGPKGGLRWARTMPGWRQRCGWRSDALVTGVAVTRSMIVVAANHQAAPPFSGMPLRDDAFLLVFSMRGGLLRTIDIEPTRLGWDDSVRDVTVGHAGTIFVTGSGALGPWTTDEVGTPVPPIREPFVMAITPTGSILWEAMLRDGDSSYYPQGYSVDLGAGILAIVTDVFDRHEQRRAYRVVRFSTEGRRLWSRAIGSPPWGYTWAEVAVAPTGATSLAAGHVGRPLLRTFRANGTLAWVGAGPQGHGYESHDVDATSAGVFVAGYHKILRYRP
jgi:hypothetical protein